MNANVVALIVALVSCAVICVLPPNTPDWIVVLLGLGCTGPIMFIVVHALYVM